MLGCELVAWVFGFALYVSSNSLWRIDENDVGRSGPQLRAENALQQHLQPLNLSRQAKSPAKVDYTKRSLSCVLFAASFLQTLVPQPHTPRLLLSTVGDRLVLSKYQTVFRLTSRCKHCFQEVVRRYTFCSGDVSSSWNQVAHETTHFEMAKTH